MLERERMNERGLNQKSFGYQLFGKNKKSGVKTWVLGFVERAGFQSSSPKVD